MISVQQADEWQRLPGGEWLTDTLLVVSFNVLRQMNGTHRTELDGEIIDVKALSIKDIDILACLTDCGTVSFIEAATFRLLLSVPLVEVNEHSPSRYSADDVDVNVVY